MLKNIENYIISLLFSNSLYEKLVCYESLDLTDELSGSEKLVIIKSDFFKEEVYGTAKTIPLIPLKLLPNSDIPFLFGDAKIEYTNNGKIILHADLIASAYYMLSRYEELIKPGCRDQHGRFLAKYSIIYQQGYGMRPLVDEWGRYLRNLLRSIGVNIPYEDYGFKKIYLTHDVDIPFLFDRKQKIIRQWIKNVIHHGKQIKKPLSIYFHPENDPQNTFEKILKKDKILQNQCGNDIVEYIYFLIAAGSKKTKAYCNIEIRKFQDLISKLHEAGATLGLHVSYEAGYNPYMIKSEMKRLLEKCKCSCTKSRHHILHWTEPEHIDQMESGGITEDFTLGYADSVGFRVGTCHPYYFINPKTRKVSNVLVHPMQIMECSLDRSEYMGLDYMDALKICKKIVDITYAYNGELVLLFHNPIWSDSNYYGKLYDSLLEYIEKKVL